MRATSTALALVPIAIAASTASAGARTRPYAGVSVEALYDSNVLNTLGADGVGRVVPRFGIVLDDHRWRFGGEYRLALHGYAQGKNENTINHRVAAEATFAATRRVALTAAATLIVADDPVLLDRTIVALPQGGVVDLLATGGGTWRASRRTTVDAAYALRLTRFSENDELSGPAGIDGDEHRADAGLTWRATRRVDLRARGRAQLFLSYDGGAPRDQYALGAAGGVGWRPAHLWRMSLDVGPIWMPGQTPSFYGNAVIVRRGRRGRLALLASRELYGGTGADQALWSSSGRLDAAWLFARQLAFRARTGGYLSEEMDGSGRVSGIFGRAELGWLAHRRGWRLDLYVEHRRQDANGGIQFDDIQRTLAGVRLSVLTGVDFLSLSEW